MKTDMEKYCDIFRKLGIMYKSYNNADVKGFETHYKSNLSSLGFKGNMIVLYSISRIDTNFFLLFDYNETYIGTAYPHRNYIFEFNSDFYKFIS